MAPKKRKLSFKAEKELSPKSIPAPLAEPTSSSNSGISRSISACQRCRKKKVKCDQRLPKCSKCEKAGSECIGLDPLTGREVPRSYVMYLEDRVNMLEQRLRDKGITLDDQETTEIRNSKVKVEDRVLSKGSIPCESSSVIVKSISISSEKTDIHTLDESQHAPSIAFSRLMSTAVKIQKRSLSNLQHPLASKRFANNSGATTDPSNGILPAILPPKSTALQFISIFFTQANPQLPIFHREEFISKYFIPIYGYFNYEEVSIASDYTSINAAFFENENMKVPWTPWFEQYKDNFQSILGTNASKASNDEIKKISNSIIPPKQYRKGLFFLNIIFAIASSVNHLQYPISISESFRLAANKYFEEVNSSTDQLESLSAILTYSLYSTMRPSNPGVWYTMGSALRTCVDLDLHNESNSSSAHNIDSFTKEKRRRLFWCTYCIDRQICFYLDRPVGIPDESINTPFPTVLDDSLVYPNETIKDFSLLANSTPSYKTVFLSMLQMRKIQSEVQKVLYTSFELPRRYDGLDSWKKSILNRLGLWKQNIPKSRKEMNCDFNLNFFHLNYYHVKLMIHGLSPKNYKLSSNDYTQVKYAAKQMINCYAQLFSTKSINYTWAAVHNIFMAGTSYLHTIYNSEDARVDEPLHEVKRVSSDCLNVLNSLIDSCEAASHCVEVFQSLTMVVIKLRYNESVQGISLIHISKDVLPKINNGNVNSNLTRLIETISQDEDLDGQRQRENDLNPFSNLSPNIIQDGLNNGPHVQQVSQQNTVPMKSGERNGSPSPTFEWMNSEDLAQRLAQHPLNTPLYDLSTFFMELDSLSPVSTNSRRSSIVGKHTPAGSVVQITPVGSISNPPATNLELGGTPMLPSSTMNSREGRKAFELIRQMPNEIIWDQFFGAPQAMYPVQGVVNQNVSYYNENGNLDNVNAGDVTGYVDNSNTMTSNMAKGNNNNNTSGSENNHFNNMNPS